SPVTPLLGVWHGLHERHGERHRGKRPATSPVGATRLSGHPEVPPRPLLAGSPEGRRADGATRRAGRRGRAGHPRPGPRGSAGAGGPGVVVGYRPGRLRHRIDLVVGPRIDRPSTARLANATGAFFFWKSVRIFLLFGTRGQL